MNSGNPILAGCARVCEGRRGRRSRRRDALKARSLRNVFSAYTQRYALGLMAGMACYGADLPRQLCPVSPRGLLAPLYPLAVLISWSRFSSPRPSGGTFGWSGRRSRCLERQASGGTLQSCCCRETPPRLPSSVLTASRISLRRRKHIRAAQTSPRCTQVMRTRTGHARCPRRASSLAPRSLALPPAAPHNVLISPPNATSARPF